MNKILKILSILVIGFVMFSCSTPTSDPTIYVPESSGPETPAPNPEVPTYSITFTSEDYNIQLFQIIVDHLNSLDEFKNLEEGTEVVLPKHLYLNSDGSEVTTEITENSKYDFVAKYSNNSEIVEIDSVTIGNKDVYIEVSAENFIQFKD